MATWSMLTGRRLKPGAYDDWRKAWQPDEWPQGVRAYILRKIDEPDEIVAFGLWEGSREGLEEMRPDSDSEAERKSRMAPFIEREFADGVYEVVEIVEG